MRFTLAKLILMLIMILSFCTSQDRVVDSNKLTLNTDDLWYFENENKPYTGIGKSYYDNGNLESEAEFENGKLSGLMISYYPNGQLEQKVKYQNGLAQDTSRRLL